VRHCLRCQLVCHLPSVSHDERKFAMSLLPARQSALHCSACSQCPSIRPWQAPLAHCHTGEEAVSRRRLCGHRAPILKKAPAGLAAPCLLWARQRRATTTPALAKRLPKRADQKHSIPRTLRAVARRPQCSHAISFIWRAREKAWSISDGQKENPAGRSCWLLSVCKRWISHVYAGFERRLALPASMHSVPRRDARLAYAAACVSVLVHQTVSPNLFASYPLAISDHMWLPHFIPAHWRMSSTCHRSMNPSRRPGCSSPAFASAECAPRCDQSLELELSAAMETGSRASPSPLHAEQCRPTKRDVWQLL
jgi:hypothetical protein